MKSISLSGDFRLAVPVLIGWCVLAVHQTVGVLNQRENSVILLVEACFFLVIAMLLIRQMASFALALLISCSFLFAYGIRLPNHVDQKPWLPQESDETSGLFGWAYQLRQNFLERTESFPGAGGQLIPGLSIGDTSRVTETLDSAMKTVSLTHITAVSGANCAIVTAFIVTISAVCGAGRALRIVLAVIALLAFVILVTPQPSVVRASVMAVVVLFTMILGRPGAGIPLLALAALMMLLWNPWWATDFGFILSVSATAGLLMFSGPLTTSLARYMPLGLASLLAIPISAQLMCQPFIVLLSPQISTYGVVANVLATPAAPMATVCGLLACLLWWLPPISSLLHWIAWLPAEWIGRTALVVSHFPSASIPIPSGVAGFVVSAMLSCLFLFMLLAPNKNLRRISLLVLIAVIGAWGLTSVFSSLRFTQSLPKNWSIAACDVGQGDALIIKSSNKLAVIDVGRKPEPLKRCFEQLGISHIDLLILTHFDKDHVGGLAAVVGKVDYAVVGKPENLEDQMLLKELADSGTRVERGVQGLRGSLGESTWQILWPDHSHPGMEVGNPGSVTSLFSFPSFQAIFLGDLGKDAQEALIHSVIIPDVDVVKVAHHGSADQSQRFYEQLHPEIALFSVGNENDYGHPRTETLEIASRLGALSPRTDEDGLILVGQTSEGLSVWTER